MLSSSPSSLLSWSVVKNIHPSNSHEKDKQCFPSKTRQSSQQAEASQNTSMLVFPGFFLFDLGHVFVWLCFSSAKMEVTTQELFRIY